MYKRVAGTKDILPEEAVLWQDIEESSRRIFSLYNYRPIRTPVIEEEQLFNRSLGGASEVVQKQMFIIRNSGEVYALRPEGTASVVRAYIENNLDKKDAFVKFYYIGPMFRLERPQKGRLRQFHHIGAEAIGSLDPSLDVEMISLADALLKSYGISGYSIEINSLGCSADRKGIAEGLKKALKAESSDLCSECKDRLSRNILRILDCKNTACKEIVSRLNLGEGHLCGECRDHFSRVKEGLNDLGIVYKVMPALVRGLDYYTRTVFEFRHNSLGSQDAIGAGGRYDNLVKELGGPEAGAIGFALGLERLLLSAGLRPPVAGPKMAFVIPLGETARPVAFKLLAELRAAGITADTDYEGKTLKGAMRRAGDLQAAYVLIIGEDEIKKGEVTLKNMSSGEQSQVARDKVAGVLKDSV